MTSEEAINHLQDISNEIDDIYIFTADEKHEALTLAINALEDRPKGEWLDVIPAYPYPFKCSVCGHMHSHKPRYCSACGSLNNEDISLER